MKSEKIVVCGGGFIGGHLVADLLRQGKKICSVVLRLEIFFGYQSAVDVAALGDERSGNVDLV